MTCRIFILALIVMVGCQLIVFDSKGAVGIAQKTIPIVSVAVMLAIVIQTILTNFGFAWWLRTSDVGHWRSRSFR